MKNNTSVFIFTLSLLLLTLFHPTQSLTQELPPFNKVRACVPYTIQIQVNNARYQVSIDGDEDVTQAFQSNVTSEGELQLLSIGDFDSNNAIKVTVELPSNKLKAVTTQGFGNIVITGDFDVEELAVASGGPNAIFADSLRVNSSLYVQNSGVGDVVLGGEFDCDIAVLLAGIGEVFLTGVGGNVELDGRGISTLGVDAISDEVVIFGKVADLGKVKYTGGQCDVKGQFFVLSPCQQVQELEIPPKSTQFSWTCGIKVKGNSTCASRTTSSTIFTNDDSSFSSSSGVSSSFASSASSAFPRRFSPASPLFQLFGSASFAASDIGNGVLFSSSSASGPSGITTVSVGGPQIEKGSAVAVSQDKCDVPKEELKI